jgi:hypothetical protein
MTTKDEIITRPDGTWGTREDFAITDILEPAIGCLRTTGTSEEKIREHLQGFIAGRIARSYPSETVQAGDENVYRELGVCVQELGGAGFYDEILRALIRHAVDLAVLGWECDCRDGAEDLRRTLLGYMKQYLESYGVPQPKPPALHLVHRKRIYEEE